MKDYPNLTKDVVQLSIMYYQTWASESYVRENMSLQVRLLQNNTSPDLWNKIQDEIKSYPPACQTGPSYFHAALKRIHNCSESTLDLVLLKIKTLKIREYEGEDIDTIVRTVNIAVTLLHHSSTSDRKYVTHDFARDTLRMFQTSTVPEFNVIFSDLERQCQVAADSKGESVVQWPQFEEITQLALATYHRLSASGQWIQGSAPAAFSAMNGWTPGTCYNCGKPNCTPSACPEPRNEEAITANKKAMEEHLKLHPKTDQSGRGSGRGNRSGSGRGRGRNSGRGGNRGRGRGRSNPNKPYRKFASDGKPLKLNPQGNYVLDQKCWAKMQKDQTIERLTVLLSTGAPPAEAPAQTSASTASTLTTAISTVPSASTAVSSQDRAAQIRDAVSRCFS